MRKIRLSLGTGQACFPNCLIHLATLLALATLCNGLFVTNASALYAQEVANQEATDRFAGSSLHDVQKDLYSDQSVVRRRAALHLLPFVLNQTPEIDSVLLKAVQHEDPAVAYWACEAAAAHLNPTVQIQQAIEKLTTNDSSLGRQLAANYADFQFRQSEDSLQFLMQVIESPFTGKTFQDTKHMAAVMTATDYLCRIGAEKLGTAAPNIIQRLEAQSAAVTKALDEKKVHGQMYHCQKACDRAALLLKSDHYESRLQSDPILPDLPQTDKAHDANSTSQISDPLHAVMIPWRGMEQPPNILWISCEDISPNLGCYGDKFASTPNLDRLATQGVLFRNAFTHAGVCAVLRSGVITGRYPISIGTQHMRSFRPTLEDPCFPQWLRQQGYFCTNRSKTDYQFQHSPETWDRENAKHNDWQERAEGQPFFSVINLTISHESQARHGKARHQQILNNLKPEQRHAIAEAATVLPPYIPNTPESRQDWAWYYDNISEMDRQVGEILDRLQNDGLADKTLVIFWSDHGQGLPRGKRSLYDSGTHVPLIVRFPDGYAAGKERKDLVTLLDLAPTMLSLTGAPIPDQLDGRVFLGPGRQDPPEELFFHRDRMDETYDLIRSVRTNRFRYLRNFQPERTYGQYLEYLELMPTMSVWRKMHQAGTLNDIQDRWFHTKPLEELYDTVNDPHQIHNLAADPDYQIVLRQLRSDLLAWQVEQQDLGMTPEVIMLEEKWPN